jgi:hypothetical protein
VATRRTALKIGAGVLVAGATAVAWRAWREGVFSTGRGPAYDAWNDWSETAGASERHLVHAAILAANPHNSQPWRFRVDAGRLDLLADPTRNIGSIDPFFREKHIGLGCALENALQAAAATGLAARLTMFPQPADPTHIATLTLESGRPAAAPLYAAIPRRHTNRGAYDRARELPTSAFAALEGLGVDLPRVAVRWFRTRETRDEIGAFIVEAARAIVGDREQSRDSNTWFRSSWSEIQARRDGLTIDAQALPAWLSLAAKILPPVGNERSDRIWLDATRDVHVATAPAFGLVLARDASENAQRVDGGRLWQRMHLWATTEGIAMHPLNQIPERADREKSQGSAPRFLDVLARLAGGGGWQALMPFRLGYPTVTARASPRRNVDEVLVA